MKLGGSLLDLPDLRERLGAYRAAAMSERALLVVGGGDAAEMVRRFDRIHGLDETTGHWLAVRAMQINALMLAAVLERTRLVDTPAACAPAWEAGELAVMEPMEWLAAEEAAGVCVPHCWQFTSDSIAALAACRLGAERLTLLKSTLPAREGEGITLEEASRSGVVDEELPRAAAGLACVELVNLRGETRAGRWPRCICAARASS